MSEKLKPRKLAPTFTQDQKWRNKVKLNTSSKRYEREVILRTFQATHSLPIPVPDDILPLFEPISLVPTVPMDGFLHGLGDFVNSRKFVQREKKSEKIPEWLETAEEHKDFVNEEGKAPEVPSQEAKEPLQKEEKTVVEEFPENYLDKDHNKKGKEVKAKKKEEVKAKKAVEHKKEKPSQTKPVESLKEEAKFIPEEKKTTEEPAIVPAYDRKLLTFFYNKGNPFAKAMVQNGFDSSDDKIYFPLGSKPYEKVWFYRDPEGNIQGPFSCIEMFNWTIRKCFPDNLEISFCNTEFVPMNSYFTELRKTVSEKKLKVPNVEGGKKTWEAVDNPVGSLKDIQKAQFVSKK